MPRREEALAAMRDALQLQDPEWDITPGTAEYKILESVAQQIENITFNSVLNDYHFDVDKKTGLELDLFMSLFGFARIKAKRATGSITFSRATDAAQDYVIPLGTQVLMPATDFAPSLYFQTTISAVLPFGGTEVSVPGQAVVAGTIGNVSSAVITGIASAVGGITGINNPQAFSGGRDAETDDDLKARWRRTVFRNISGTEDQFLAVAFNEAAYVTRANLVGPIERYLEQIQLQAPYDLTTASPWAGTLNDAGGGLTNSELDVTVTAGHGDRFSVATLADPDSYFYIGVTWTDDGFGVLVPKEIMKVTNRAAGSDDMTVVRAATSVTDNLIHTNGVAVRQVFPSSVPDSKYTFPPGGEVVGLDTAVTSQQLGRSGETGDYVLVTFDGTFTGTTGSAPIPAGNTLPFLYVTTDGATTFGFDSVIQLEHEYTPISSRNDFSDTGCKTADKVDIFVDGEDPVTVTEQFPFPDPTTIDFGGAYTSSDFLRDDEVNTPQDGNLYTPLSKAPITTLPSSISVAATNTQAASTYYKDEDYWLVSDSDDAAGLEGSPRASNGIEWKEPLSITDDAAYGAGVFTATVQVTSSGKLSGWYAYVVTYEVDGIETISITDTPEAPAATNDATHKKNDLVIPLYVPGPAHSTIWRKIYRSVSSTTSAAALEGPFYLLAVIKNNVTAAYEDNTADDALADIQPPKAPPEAGTLVNIDYNYNRLIERLDAQMDQVRLVGMDVLAHAADDVQLKFNLAVVMFPGAGTPSDVESDLNTILTAWINRKSFRNNIQIADLIEQAGQASGIDNVRLVRAGEERNEVQLVTATTTRATPDPALDTFKITIDGDVTGAIAYNESMASAREILEALPNIHEGNTFATQLNGAVGSTSSTSIQVDDNAGLHLDSDINNVNSVVGGTAGWGSPGLYIQVDDEIMLLTVAADAGGTQTWTVKRAQLRTTGATHLDNADVHILGDVAVSYAASGVDHAFTIYFLPNYYTEVNDWGSRKLDLVTVAKTADTSKLTLTVARRAQGVGSGIQQIAANDQTIMATHYDDFYLDSDELPSIAGVDVLNRAQNTF